MKFRMVNIGMAGLLLAACAAGPHDASVADDPNTDLDKKAREMGYHLQRQGEEKIYCKSSAPTASRISRQECLTAAQMAQFVQQAARNEADLARRQQQNLSGARSVN